MRYSIDHIKKSETQKAFDAVVEGVKELYPPGNPISDAEAVEAANRLITFCKILMEIKATKLKEKPKPQETLD